MKKRVISLLLLVVMLVTAVPLATFLSLAAGPAVTAETEEEEFDYNGLYAGYSDIVYYLDFFKLNTFWGGVVPEEVAAPADTFTGDKVYETGEMWDANTPKLAPTADYAAAIESYKTTMQNLLNSFVVKKSTITLNIKLADINGRSWNDMDGSAQKVNFTFGPGYIQLRYIHSNSYLNFAKLPTGGIITGEYVTTGGSRSVGQFYLTRGLPVDMTVVGDDITFTKFSAYSSNNSAEADFEDFTVPGGATTPFTFTVQSTRADNGHDLIGDIWVNGEQKVDDVIVTKPTAKDTGHIGYGSYGTQQVYAVRYYNRALSAEEQAQNRFADFAKWFKLDMSLYASLNSTAKLEAQAALLAAADAASISFTNDVADRDVLQNVLDEFALDVIYGQLESDTVNGTKVNDFAAIARALRIDISGVLVLPADKRSSIYDIVINNIDLDSLGSADFESTQAYVQGLIDREISAIVDTYPDIIPAGTTIVTDYKTLYVHQDKLVVWADFFASKASDGLLYMSHSYENTNTTWDRSKYGNQYADGATVANWNLPDKLWDPVNKKFTTNLNTDKIRNPEISGEQAALSKYVYKGGGTWGTTGAYLYFADIPDAGWGHSNIRQWGDGCLIGDPNGLPNNSWKILTPGKSESQITYQYVMGYGEKGGSNVQLDGFRMNVKLKDGYFSVTDYTYYGYGVGTDGYTLSNNAMMTAKPTNATTTAVNMADFTVTLDKHLGEDSGHYYEEVYQINGDGAIRYHSDLLNKDLYRYETSEGIYLVDTKDCFVAYYTMNVAGKVFYITDANGAVVESLPITKADDGTMTPDWENATLAGEDAERPTTPTVIGPYYKNPFTEVGADTLGATGPIVYAGTYDMTVYGNGQELLYAPNLSYQPSDIGWVGNGTCLTTYAIRTYKCVLTETEIHQNHFADLAGFYGLDLAVYSLLTPMERISLHKDLSAFELGYEKAVGVEEYEKAIAKYLYDFDMSVPGADNFLSICQNFGLDARAVKDFSHEAQARIFAKFANIDPNGRNYPKLLQSMVKEAVTEEQTLRYASAYGHKTIAFEGWQVRQTGTQAMRALFSTDLNLVADLEARGATVQTGVLIAKKTDTLTSPDKLRVIVGDGGAITIGIVGADGTIAEATEGVELVQGYWNGAFSADSTLNADATLLSFTKETVINVVTDPTDDRLGLDEDDLADPDYVATAIDRENRKIYQNDKYMYVGFTVVTAEDGTVSIFYEEATLNGIANAFSMYDIVKVAKVKYKMAAPNMQAIFNTIERTNLISGQIADKAIEDYTLVLGADADVQNSLQNTIASALGFSLDTIRRTETVGDGYIFIGLYDNLYDSTCYGMSIYSGNIYLWANADAEMADAVALLADFIDACKDKGIDFTIGNNLEVVRRAK